MDTEFLLTVHTDLSSTILEWKGLHLSDVAVNYRVSALSLEVQGSTSLCFWCSSVRWVAGSSLSRSIRKIILVKHSHRRLRPKRLAIDRSSSMSLVFECGRNGTMVPLIHDQRWHMLAGTASSPWKISSALLRGFWRQQSYAGAELFQRTLEDGWRAAYERPNKWWGEAKENQLYGTVRHWSYHSWPPSPNEHRKFETEREKVPCCDCARAKGRQFGSVWTLHALFYKTLVMRPGTSILPVAWYPSGIWGRWAWIRRWGWWVRKKRSKSDCRMNCT